MKLSGLRLGQMHIVRITAVPDQAIMRSLQKLEPVASAELLTPKGKIDLAGGHVNSRDGLLFSDDRALLGKIKHALAEGLSRALVRIGTKYWPVTGLQEMKSSSWSFVLDYDEHREIPRREAVQMIAQVTPKHYSKPHMQHNVCDPKMYNLMKNPAKIKEIWSKVFKDAQSDPQNPPTGWKLFGNGQVLPTSDMEIKKASLAKDAGVDRCECGKSLDYVFEVSLPTWFVEAADLSSDSYWLGAECVKLFWILTRMNPGQLADVIKRSVSKLRTEKKIMGD